MDAIRFLEQDHHAIEQLFEELDRASESDQGAIVNRICMELDAHTRIEREIFYPAVRSGLGRDGEELVDEALHEHSQMTELVERLRAMSSSDRAFLARVSMLMDDVRHHVDEEESEMFPLIHSNMASQLDQIGERLEQRKQELLARA